MSKVDLRLELGRVELSTRESKCRLNLKTLEMYYNNGNNGYPGSKCRQYQNT